MPKKTSQIKRKGTVRRRPEQAAAGKVCPVVAIGASAGGLEALEQFLKKVPPAPGLAFVVVTHLDPKRASLLPELLAKRTRMPVVQVTDKMGLKPDTVHIIPPNKEMVLSQGRLCLREFSLPRGANLPIDIFLRSLAAERGSLAIAVILSGTGSDGTLGLRAVKAELGMAMVQDTDSAAFAGMPASAAGTGLADYILPPSKMPPKLLQYCRHARTAPAQELSPKGGVLPLSLRGILTLLRARTTHDFSHYKMNTISRRVGRRMSVHRISDIDRYRRFLMNHPEETDALFKDLLIGVTSFFRDPAAFKALNTALAKRLKAVPEGESFRAWVPGCATGEEAYSLAMLLQERLERCPRRLDVQIFATDIDPDAIAFARAGLYPDSIRADLSAARLRTHFSKEKDGRYRVRKPIRDMLVFAPQDIIKDPPFTRLDLLSCRNLLIYLTPPLQGKLLPMFHYCLKPGGLLLLGPSESPGCASDQLKTLDRRWKLFSRETAPLSGKAPPARLPRLLPAVAASGTAQRPSPESMTDLVETLLHQTKAPPCAVVDAELNTVYFHGRVGRYLEPPPGRPEANILRLARPGLAGELAKLLHGLQADGRPHSKRNVEVDTANGTRHVDLDVRALPGRDNPRMMLIEFREKPREKRPARKGRGRPDPRELEDELRRARSDRQASIEKLQSANEELQSANEELQSTNEELQSTNEELETSKEELQSLNEESSTVNAELQARIDELGKSNDDMKNLLDSTDIATIFLDAELRVRRFTPRAADIIPLQERDIGRPIEHFASTIKEVSLHSTAEAVLEDLSSIEREVSAGPDRRLLMRARPYRTINNVIDGVVISFLDLRRDLDKRKRRTPS